MIEINSSDFGTFGSSYKNYYLNKNNLLIPYKNIVVSQKVSGFKGLLFLNYANLYFNEFKVLKYLNVKKSLYDPLDPEVICLGGIDLNIGEDTETELVSNQIFIELLNISEFSTSPYEVFKEKDDLFFDCQEFTIYKKILPSRWGI